jgi:zinc/manganese transport system substrate-binding protein
MRLKILFALILTLSSLNGAASAKLAIVTTTPALAAVAQAVAGDKGRVTSLSLPTQDPHFVDARPNLALELSKADLLVVVGLGLEVGWLPTLLTASRNGAIQTGSRGYLDASGLVGLLDVPSGKVDRTMGDIHPGGNPHYMVDPRRAARVAEGLARRMAELDPGEARTYSRNASDFVAKLDKWRKHWEAELAPLKGAQVVGYHQSLSYLADWLGLRLVGYLEPKPGVPPNPGHVARLIELAKANHVRLLLQESYFPTNTSTLVAQKVGAKLVVLPGGPDVRGGESYLGFVNSVVERLGAK